MEKDITTVIDLNGELAKLTMLRGRTRIAEGEEPDAAFAAKVAALREPVYVYFRHEDEPTAPAYAAQLLELV